MGKLGWGEIVVILILALVVLGPDKLPKAGRALGQAVRSVKKYIHETTKELEEIDELREIKKDVEDIKKDVRDMGKTIEQSVTEAETDAKAAVESAADMITQEETENG